MLQVEHQRANRTFLDRCRRIMIIKPRRIERRAERLSQTNSRLGIHIRMSWTRTKKVCQATHQTFSPPKLTFQTDIIARISVYSLSEPSPSFAPLLRPLLNPKSIPETLIVILLDWSSPWTWIRQLREWVRLLRHVLYSLDDDTKMVMDEVMSEWRDRKRGAEGAAVAGGAAGATIPLGPGEWDEGLGLPLCIVCQKVSVLWRCWWDRD